MALAALPLDDRKRSAMRQRLHPPPAVLIATDDAALAGLLRELLAEEGYAPQHYRTGQTALVALRQCAKPSVVLLSLHCPSLPSWAVLQHIAQEEALQRHAYLLWTAVWDFLTAEERAFAHDLGVVVVPKPCPLQQLVDAVAQATARLVDPPASTTS